MAIDRSKFKPTKVSAMKEADKQVQDAMKKGGAPRPGMLEISAGINKFRIFPAHPEEDAEEQPPFSQPSVKVFVPCMVKERDADGNETGNEKESMRPVFNSRIHGGTEKDLIEEYVKLARAYAEAKWGDDPKNKVAKGQYLDKVYGKYNQANPKQSLPGLRYTTTHVVYAKKLNETGTPFGRLELKDSIKQEMNRLAAVEASDDPLGVDPYTDLDDGRPIIVDYDKTRAQAKDYYKVNIDYSTDKVTKRLLDYPITEDDLEKFDKQPTLKSMYVDVFTSKDFALQLAGLEMYDKKYNLGIVGTPEYEAVVEEISAYYNGTEEEIEEIEPVEEQEEETEEKGDAYSLMSRVELKQFISKEKLGIVVKPSISDEELRDLVRQSMKDRQIPHIPLPGEDDYEEQEEAEEKPKSDTLSKLKGLRK